MDGDVLSCPFLLADERARPRPWVGNYLFIFFVPFVEGKFIYIYIISLIPFVLKYKIEY